MLAALGLRLFQTLDSVRAPQLSHRTQHASIARKRRVKWGVVSHDMLYVYRLQNVGKGVLGNRNHRRKGAGRRVASYSTVVSSRKVGEAPPTRPWKWE